MGALAFVSSPAPSSSFLSSFAGEEGKGEPVAAFGAVPNSEVEAFGETPNVALPDGGTTVLFVAAGKGAVLGTDDD